MLMVLGVILLLLALIYHYYTKWEYYKVSWKTPGPWCLPFIGSLRFIMDNILDSSLGVLKTMKYYRNNRMSIWIGSRYLFVTQNPKDIEIVLTHPECFDKLDLVYDKLEPATGNGLIRSQTEVWKRHRKLISPSFTKTVIESFIDDLYKNSCRLVDEIRKDYGNDERDISYFMYNFAIWSYCDNFMGVDVVELNRKHHWGTILLKGNKLIWERMFNLIETIDFIYNLLPKSKVYHNTHKEYNQFYGGVLDMSIEKFKNYQNDRNNEKKPKILVELILELGAQKILSPNEIEDELKTFLAAGTDTTAMTLSFIAVILGMYPEIQETVHQEVLEVCGRSDPIRLNHVHQLKYLERVINEVMRLFPLGSQLARKTRDYIDLGDIVLPPGTGVFTVIYNVHRDERHWKDPLRFDPDRFLPEECAKRNPYTFLPFMAGPRNCIGMKYGMFQLKIAVANLVRNFKLHSKYKKIEEIDIEVVIFTKIRGGFQCKIEPRL